MKLRNFLSFDSHLRSMCLCGWQINCILLESYYDFVQLRKVSQRLSRIKANRNTDKMCKTEWMSAKNKYKIKKGEREWATRRRIIAKIKSTVRRKRQKRFSLLPHKMNENVTAKRFNTRWDATNHVRKRNDWMSAISLLKLCLSVWKRIDLQHERKSIVEEWKTSRLKEREELEKKKVKKLTVKMVSAFFLFASVYFCYYAFAFFGSFTFIFLLLCPEPRFRTSNA